MGNTLGFHDIHFFQKIDQNDNAYDCYENALKLNHAYPQAHNNIGMISLKKRELNSAVKSFEWAVAYNPNYVAAHNNLGAVFQELLLYEKAKEQFRAAKLVNARWRLRQTCRHRRRFVAFLSSFA